jgi:hypothetical protein
MHALHWMKPFVFIEQFSTGAAQVLILKYGEVSTSRTGDTWKCERRRKMIVPGNVKSGSLGTATETVSNPSHLTTDGRGFVGAVALTYGDRA